MLRATAAIILCLLPSQVTGLIRTNAECLAGNEWMFSSIGQSPCDVAAELASVCVSRPYNLDSLPAGGVYLGPDLTNQTSCVCNSVYYSLLSACAHCQGQNYLRWSTYYTNCTVIYLTIYTKQIPVGVKVPAYAYQDVSVSGTFDVTLAQSRRGIESSRAPPSSTQIPTSSSTDAPIVNDIPSIVGGVVGGLVALGLIAALITFIVLRSKRKITPQNNNSGFQRRPNMAFVPDTPASHIRSTMSPPPGSPRRVYKASTSNNQTTYPSAHRSIKRQRSPSLNRKLTPDFTKNGARNHDVPPQLPNPNDTGGRSRDTASGRSES